MPSTELSSPPAPLSTTELAERFGFSLDDLALNRAGQLSARQRQIVFYRSWGYLMRGIVLAVFSIGATIMLSRTDTEQNRAVIAVMIALCAVLIALLVFNGYRVLRPTVQTVTGSLRRGDDAWHPSILVGSTAIRITTRRWRHLEPHIPGLYRAYIDPAGRLLSIEPEHKD